MIEKYHSGLIWKITRRCPYFVAGLRRAGFTGGWLYRGGRRETLTSEQAVPINRQTARRFVSVVKGFLSSEVRWRALGLFAALIGFLFAISGLNYVNSYVGRDESELAADITRDRRRTGTLRHYVDEHSVTGLTSNPTIVDNAFTNSAAYNAATRKKRTCLKSCEDMFFDLDAVASQLQDKGAKSFVKSQNELVTVIAPARAAPRRPVREFAMNVLVVDVGGTHVKLLATGQSERREFVSGPTLTAEQMVAGVKELAQDWKYDVVSIGYPGPVLHGLPVAEPHNQVPRRI